MFTPKCAIQASPRSTVGAMAKRTKRDGFDPRSCAMTDGDCRTNVVETAKDHESGEVDRTVPEEIADLGVEVQAMFERVRVRLGLRSGGAEMIGRYELRDWIGRGGMGEVYRGYDTELERDVAIKLISPRPLSDVELLRQRLRREAQLLAKLDHENVVKVYDTGVHQGRGYLVMEFVRGATLHQLQAVGALTERERVSRYAEAGRGLLAAHVRGIVHRDFKPDNVFVGDDGRARVGDFGLAHALGEFELRSEGGADDERPVGLTQVGEIVGTLGYMAPEQLRGDPSDARADQFAFCVAVWEALGDGRPFAGASVRALIESMDGEPRGGEGIDARLRRVLKTGLAPRPEERHASIAVVVEALEELLDRPQRRRQRRVLGGLGLLALAGLIAAGLGYRAAHPHCPLADEVAELDATADWAAVAEGSSVATAEHFRDRIAAMETMAERSCLVGDVAGRQHVEGLLASLRSLLDSVDEEANEGWDDRVRAFEIDFVTRATVPMSDEGYEALSTRIAPHEASWDLPSLIDACDGIALESRSEADRAGLLLPCGRARSILGDYDAAIADFKQARRATEVVGDDQRRLRAVLGAAKTTIMREQEYERGAELLEQAGDLLVALDVGLWDVRRAEYRELASLLAAHEEQLGEAIALQLRVVGRQLLFGTNEERVPALVNLANHFDRCEQPWPAELAYRLALYFDPNDPELTYNLGRLLLTQTRDAEARKWLDQTLVLPNHDLHLITTACLLILDVSGDDRQQISSRRARLVEMLSDPQTPRTPQQAQQSWAVVDLADARLDELGPD